MRFLFFIEREFHISLFTNLIKLIGNENYGEVGLLFSEYNEKSRKKSFGVRKSILHNYLESEVKIVANPFEYSPDYTFVADSSYEKVEGLGKIISIGHGTISKGSFYTDSPLSIRENCADLIFVPGAIHKEILQKQIKTPVIISGIPKLDTLTSEINKNEIYSEMNLDINKKTILIAPTFNSEFSLLTDLLETTFIDADYNYIFKLHGVETQENIERVKNICSDNSNTFLYESYDISRAMQISDILVSDISSVIYEYIIQDKPVVLYNSKHVKKFKKYDSSNLEYRFRNIGITFNNIKDLASSIKESFVSDPFKDNRRKVSKMFVKFSKEYSASKFILDYIIDNPLTAKATIILKYGKNYQVLKKLYSAKFKIITIENKKEIFSQAKNLKSGNIIFMDSDYNYSANYPDLMDGFLHKNKEKIVAPLIKNSNVKKQNIEQYFPITKTMSDNQISQSLTYQKPGEFVFSEIISSSSFGFSNTIAFDLENFKFGNDTIKYKNNSLFSIILFGYCYE